MEQYPDEVWSCEISQDAQEDLVSGNRAQDATKSHTGSEDAQDVRDANLTFLVSGCKADVSDAPYIFADAMPTTIKDSSTVEGVQGE